jgi:hypothetical protein
MEPDFAHILFEKDISAQRRMRDAVQAVTGQPSFDSLFRLVFHHQRPVAAKAAEAVEKITKLHPGYLEPHRGQLFQLFNSHDHKDVKTHLPQLVSRLALSHAELVQVWNTLSYWARNPNESKNIRSRAIQALFDIASANPTLSNELNEITATLEHEPIPSLQARLRKLRAKTTAGK